MVEINKHGGTKDKEKVDFCMHLICSWGGEKLHFQIQAKQKYLLTLVSVMSSSLS